MDLKEVEKIYDTLYHDVNGYTISSIGRKKLSYYDKSLTYGEVTPSAFYDIINQIFPDKNDVFYDLGAGTGKAVILASLLFGFKKSAGVEIIDDLWKASQTILARY